MGFRSLNSIIGRADLLERNNEVNHWKTRNIDLSGLLTVPGESDTNSVFCTAKNINSLGEVMDLGLIAEAEEALANRQPVHLSRTICNTDRATGAMLSGRVAERYGSAGLPDRTISGRFTGSAGQSFGAFLACGIEFYLEGEANDFLGKGLSGGRIIVVPPEGSLFDADKNVIIGNTTLYGATSGEIFISGIAGERFAVRNSGATAVVEGAGNHCCEYMTGGRVVVLGSTGNNFAAGMSGGIAYVLNEEGDFDYYCNMGMVELTLVENISDKTELIGLISDHYRYTGSKKAKEILDNQQKYIDMFIKVTPYDYKRVLQEQKLEEIKRKMADVEMDVEYGDKY
jgi:glutamate synthase (NADPH/NADH) large chain